MVAIGWLTLVGVAVSRAAETASELGERARREFECRFASTPITIDGRADEAAWADADVIDHFYLPWLGDEARAAKTTTTARLLWDREYLYFFAEMEDHDLFADVTEHDGKTWDNDVFELFFKPADDKPGYYEFQVNAAGTVLDMFLPRRGDGGYERYAGDGDFHVESRVTLRGTLNQRTDRDQGWSVEGRIPWFDFLRSGGRPAVDERWKFALCRYDFSVDSEEPELSTSAPLDSLTSADFHHHEDYSTLRFVGPSVAAESGLETLQNELSQVPSRVVGSPDPPLPYRVERVFPELQPSWPIFMIEQPGTQRLLVIDQQAPYGATRLCRTSETPADGTLETLLEFPAGGVAYSAAFHPRYEDNGYVYVGWNGGVDGGAKQSRVTRYTIDREPPYRLDPDSALTIIEWPSAGHNGAAVDFGTDGMLYVTSGDGTSDSDVDQKGQGLDHLLAKLLRIDVDHPAPGQTYSIPPDNPFVDVEGARGETWAYGFRNPWRLNIDRQTGDVWVGNNGQDLWEQVYLVQRGANYGWSVYEGGALFYPNRELGPTPVSKPTFDHPHSEARSLTGGIVYRGDRLPELHGAYIYGDYSTGKIWAAKVSGGQVEWHRELADTTLQITAFAVDTEGRLLVADHRAAPAGGFYSLIPNPEAVAEADSAASSERSPAFPKTLSDSGLFDSVAGHRLHPGLIPYSVNSPLWSDGAHKARFIALPSADPTITVKPTRGWEFPDQTVLVKSFALDLDERDPSSRRWVETRFMTKQQGEWVGYSYLWNEEQTEATLVDAAGTERSFEIRTRDGELRQQSWRYPSRTECMVCHSRAANFVLGLSTLQLNKDHDYGGATANQLSTLEQLGVLRIDERNDVRESLRAALRETGYDDPEVKRQFAAATAAGGQRATPPATLFRQPPDRYDRLVDPYDEAGELTARARSYLHANCAQCHVNAGGGNSQIDLEYGTPLAKTAMIDVTPLHHRFELPEAKLIAPGAPDRSVLLHRVAIRGPGQMPQLATSRVDESAVELLRAWIAGLSR